MGSPAERAQRGKAQQKRQQEQQQQEEKEEGGEAGPSTRVAARRSGKTLPQLTSPSIDLTARVSRVVLRGPDTCQLCGAQLLQLLLPILCLGYACGASAASHSLSNSYS